MKKSRFSDSQLSEALRPVEAPLRINALVPNLQIVLHYLTASEYRRTHHITAAANI